jgi:hypothetical protein
MIYASTPVSRHHSYLCQLIQKMELRFGADHEVVTPLRNEVAHFDAEAPHYRAIRVTRHAEPSISVMQRLWDSRSQKMRRARTPLPLPAANIGQNIN